jgi:hypothetical protein
LEKIRDGSTPFIRLSGGKLHAQDDRVRSLPEQSISIEIRLARNIRGFIEVRYYVENKEATPFAESSIVPFPLNLRRPSFRIGQAGSVIDPARDIVAGANRSLWCADWAYASNDSMGIGIALDDMPLVSIGSTGIFEFAPDRVPEGSTMYAHLSNTQWGTNFPQWLEGSFAWQIRIAPDVRHHGGASITSRNTNESRIIAYKWDRHFKVLFCELLSVRPRHDGRGLIVRVKEERGRHTKAWLQPRDPIKAIWRCDLLERPIEKLDLQHESAEMDGGLDIPLQLAPYAIETLLVEFE